MILASCLGTALLCSLLLAAPPSARAQEQPLPVGFSGPMGNALLSNETTITRYAMTRSKGRVYVKPDARSRVITSLHFETEESYSEIYLLQRSLVDSHGVAWLKIRLPMRPNGTTGWVKRTALGELHTVTTQFVIRRGALRATLYRSGRKIWSARVGVGKASTPTPRGNFWIREKIKVPGNGLGTFGPYAFGTANYSTISDWPNGGVVAVHGTNQPSLIPGRPSHGCVRVRNPDIKRLWKLMPVGTPMRVM